MGRLFKYDEKGMKYVKDTKMGKRWRAKGLGERGKSKKSEEKSGALAQELKVEKRKRKRFWPGTVA